MSEQELAAASCAKNNVKAARAHCEGVMTEKMAQSEYDDFLKNDNLTGAFASLLDSAKTADYDNQVFWRSMQIAAESLQLADESIECHERMQQSQRQG